MARASRDGDVAAAGRHLAAALAGEREGRWRYGLNYARDKAVYATVNALIPVAAGTGSAASDPASVEPEEVTRTASSIPDISDSLLRCELPDGRIVPYLDLGNGLIAVPAGENEPSQGSDFSFVIGMIMGGTDMPTVDKRGAWLVGAGAGV